MLLLVLFAMGVHQPIHTQLKHPHFNQHKSAAARKEMLNFLEMTKWQVPKVKHQSAAGAKGDKDRDGM